MAHRIHSYLPALILAFWATASAQPGHLDFLKAHDSSFALLANLETMLASTSGGVARKVCDGSGTATGWTNHGRILYAEDRGIGYCGRPGRLPVISG